MSIAENIDQHKDLLKYIQLVRMISFQCDDHQKDIMETAVKMILKSGFDINYQIPSDCPVRVSEYRGNMSVLHQAVKRSSKAIVELLLNKGADFTCKNQYGLTPLLELLEVRALDKIVRGQVVDDSESTDKIINCLLSAHIQFDNSNNPTAVKHSFGGFLGFTHFHAACQTGNVEVVRFFLENGVAVNQAVSADSTRFPGYTGLHLAKNADVIRVLSLYGADFTCLNARGLSPLHLIIQKVIDLIENKKIIESLELKDVLDLMLEKTIGDFNTVDQIGLTRLHVYCTKLKNTDYEVFRNALNQGMNVNAPVNFDSPVWPGYTPLHFAARLNVSTVIWLLKNGANLLAKDASGTMPLDFIVKRYKINHVYRILSTQKALKSVQFENDTNLLDVMAKFQDTNDFCIYLQNADFHSKIQSDSLVWSSYTLLHLSLILKKSTFIDEILHVCSESINMMDLHNVSSLFHVACILSKINIVEKFLSNGLSPNVRVSSYLINFLKTLPKTLRIYEEKKELLLAANGTALHLAVVTRNDVLISLLLQHGADPCLLDADGFTCIHREFLNDRFIFPGLWNHPNISRSNPVAPGGLSHFHVACYCHNTRTAQLLLPFVTNINEPINAELLNFTTRLPLGIRSGDTPLHLACKHILLESEEIFHFLVDNGADLMIKNEKGIDSLHVLLNTMYCEAMARKILRIVSKLENQDLLLNDKGLTPLHLACAAGELNSMKMCLEAGAYVNSQISMVIWKNYTPLQIVIASHCCWLDEKVKLLVEFGANLSSVCDQHEVERFQRFYNDYPELLKNVRGKKPNVYQEILITYCQDYIKEDRPNVVQNLLKLGIDVNTPCLLHHFGNHSIGDTLLHAAVKNGSIKVIEVLLENGADISLENVHGYTPVHLAALKYAESFIVILRATKVNVETTENVYGRTIFNCLVHNQNVSSDVYFHLFKYGLEMDNIEFSTKSRLIKEFVNRFPEDIFESLIKCIPHLDVVDNEDNSIIHHLVEYNIYDCEKLLRVIEILVNNGCELDHQGNEGKTPLHCSVLEDDFDSTKALLLAGADINTTDINGLTPFAHFRELHPRFDEEDEEESVGYLLKSYISRLQTTDLTFHPLNDIDEDMLTANTVSSELYEMELINVTVKCTLRDILKEETLLGFPMIKGRQAILDFITSNELQLKFPDWVPIFKWQRRNFLKRMEIFKLAVNALNSLTNLPIYCVEMILIYLDNDDLEKVQCCQYNSDDD